MNLKPTLAVSLFAVVAALSVNASTAADTANASPAADSSIGATAERATSKKKLQPHSHVQEKHGYAPKAPEAMPDKPNPANDRTKHFHPRDGK